MSNRQHTPQTDPGTAYMLEQMTKRMIRIETRLFKLAKALGHEAVMHEVEPEPPIQRDMFDDNNGAA